MANRGRYGYQQKLRLISANMILIIRGHDFWPVKLWKQDNSPNDIELSPVLCPARDSR